MKISCIRLLAFFANDKTMRRSCCFFRVYRNVSDWHEERTTINGVAFLFAHRLVLGKFRTHTGKSLSFCSCKFYKYCLAISNDTWLNSKGARPSKFFRTITRRGESNVTLNFITTGRRRGGIARLFETIGLLKRLPIRQIKSQRILECQGGHKIVPLFLTIPAVHWIHRVHSNLT